METLGYRALSPRYISDSSLAATVVLIVVFLRSFFQIRDRSLIYETTVTFHLLKFAVNNSHL
jgi:uncharacterized membrane protein